MFWNFAISSTRRHFGGNDFAASRTRFCICIRAASDSDSGSGSEFQIA
jgi:hypothetical protein